MSEKFEQKRITIGEEALEKSVAKKGPVIHSKEIHSEDFKEEFQDATRYKEITERDFFTDRQEKEDITEETLMQAEYTIGALMHRQEMAGKVIEKHQSIFNQLQDTVKRKEQLESILQGLEESNEINTPKYNSIKNQYEDALRRYNNLESRAIVPEGNLIDKNEEVIDLENQIIARDNALHPKEPDLN